MQLKDFVPAPAEPTPEDLGLALIFGSSDPPLNSNVFSSSSVLFSTSGYGLTVNSSQGSNNWFRLTMGGHYTLTITLGYTSEAWIPYQLTVDGEKVAYVSANKGKTGCEYTYIFDAQAGAQIASPVAPGWFANSTVTSSFLSFFVTHKVPSIASTLTRIKHHATGRLNTYRANHCASIAPLQPIKESSIMRRRV